MKQESGKHKSATLPEKLAWAPILLMPVVMAVLWIADFRPAWHLPVLNWLVHYGSGVVAIALIVVPAARSFLASGQASVLTLSCGVLMSEIGVLAMPSGFLRSSSAAFAIYNISVLLSGICHFAGIVITSRGKVRLGRVTTWLTSAYAGACVVMGLVIWSALTGHMPVFFIDGRGGTLVRNLVVSAAVAFFMSSAGLLWLTNRRLPSPFLYWYALGLFLIAAGLAGSMLIIVKDSPLQWAARFTQLFGMAYMCAAVFGSMGGSSMKGIVLSALEEAWRQKDFMAGFRHQAFSGRIARYGLAAAATGGSMALRLVFSAWVGPGLPTYITFYPAVAMVALVGGFGPGLVATALASFIAAYWILPPVGQFSIASPVNRLGIVLFTCMGLFLSVFAEFYRRHRHKAAAYEKELALRESRKQLSDIYASMSDGLVIHEIIYDNSGKAVDYLITEVNPAFEKITGFARDQVIGRKASVVFSLEKALYLDIYSRVASTGKSESFETYFEKINKHLSVSVFSPGEGKFATIFQDITERKQAEDKLRRVSKRNSFIVTFADALRPLTDAGQIKAAAARALGQHLRVHRATYAEVTPGGDVVIECGYTDGVKDIAGRYRLDDYGPELLKALRTGRNIVVADVQNDAGFSEQEKARYRAVQVTANLNVPIVKDGLPVALLALHQAWPRLWTDDEVSLAEEAAERTWEAVERARVEDKLRQSEERLRRFYESGLLGVIYWNMDGIITDANDKFLEMVGYSREELNTGKIGWVAMTPPEYRYLDEQAVIDLKAAGIQNKPFEKEYIRKDGTRIPVVIAAAMLDQERFNGVAFVLDITDRKRAQVKAQTVRDRFYSVLSTMPLGVLLVAEEGRVEFANQAFCDIFNLQESPEALKLLTSAEIIEKIQPSYLDPAQAQKRIKEIVSRGQPVKDEDVHMRGERTYLRDFIPIRLGDNKYGRIWIHKDITERTQAEQALQLNRERLDLALVSSRMATFDWDIITNKRTWSDGVHSLLGTDPAFFAGAPEDFFRVVHAQDRSGVQAALDKAVATGVYETEYRAVWPDGSIRYIAARGRVHNDSTGRPVAMTGICWDITDQKLAEEVLRRDKETVEKLAQERTGQLVEAQLELEKAKRLSDIGVLAATVAHELRNPLAAISMAAYNLKRKAVNPDLEKHLATINKKVVESDQIINNLLFYSRLKPPHFEDINIFDIINECSEALEKQSKKEVTVTKHIDPVRGIIIEADPYQAKEVFHNIFNNAYDAVPSEDGRIKILAENEEGFVKVTIEDNGAGIDKDVLDKVFDPFFTTKAKGTGLGLSVCQQIVNFHDGSIVVASRAGQGAVITVCLPKTRKKA